MLVERNLAVCSVCLDLHGDHSFSCALARGASALVRGASDADGTWLPEAALAPGTRLRVFLAEEGAADDAWQVGEADWTTWKLPPGKSSPYMQQVYAPLFAAEW